MGCPALVPDSGERLTSLKASNDAYLRADNKSAIQQFYESLKVFTPE